MLLDISTLQNIQLNTKKKKKKLPIPKFKITVSVNILLNKLQNELCINRLIIIYLLSVLLALDSAAALGLSLLKQL